MIMTAKQKLWIVWTGSAINSVRPDSWLFWAFAALGCVFEQDVPRMPSDGSMDVTEAFDTLGLSFASDYSRAVDAGVSAHAVANALGHESFATTAQSYAKPEALTRAKQRRVLNVLAGGRR